MEMVRVCYSFVRPQPVGEHFKDIWYLFSMHTLIEWYRVAEQKLARFNLLAINEATLNDNLRVAVTDVTERHGVEYVIIHSFVCACRRQCRLLKHSRIEVSK